MCLFTLVILSIWHAIIGGLIFLNTSEFRVTPRSWYVYLDRYVLFLSIGVYVIIHVIFFIWLYCVPLKLRRKLKQKDVQYRQLISKERQSPKTKLNNNLNYIPVSIES